MMKRDEVIQLVRTNKAELHKRGIRSVALFGSVARDEASADSDVDLLVDLAPPYTYDRYIEAKFYFEDLLGCSVDLVMQETLKPRLRSRGERETILVT